MIRLSIILVMLSSTTIVDEVPHDGVETVVKSSRVFASAKPIVRSAPKFPSAQQRRNKEAWVQVTYCIDESGIPRNVSVLNSVGGGAFENAAVSSVQQWKFEPATIDGVPSWQSGNNVYVSFVLDEQQKAADDRFIRNYRKLGRLFEKGSYEEFDELFSDLYGSDNLSLYELAKLWAQRVRYEAVHGDMYKLHMALTRATASNGQWIEKKSYVQLLALRIRVEAKLEKYSLARSSYRKLLKAAGEDAKQVIELRAIMDQLKKDIESDAVLKVEAEVRAKGDCSYCNDSWYFTPVRNVFSIANVRGKLSTIDMRCDHKRYEADIAEDVEWHVPDNWGQCKIQLYGNPGTTMDVLQFPAS